MVKAKMCLPLGWGSVYVCLFHYVMDTPRALARCLVRSKR